jgi:hypothetical protein
MAKPKKKPTRIKGDAPKNCGCAVSNKPAKIENAGYYWIMCRRPAGARSGKPGTFSKRASDSCM